MSGGIHLEAGCVAGAAEPGGRRRRLGLHLAPGLPECGSGKLGRLARTRGDTVSLATCYAAGQRVLRSPQGVWKAHRTSEKVYRRDS